jgi:hypothetical protein
VVLVCCGQTVYRCATTCYECRLLCDSSLKSSSNPVMSLNNITLRKSPFFLIVKRLSTKNGGHRTLTRAWKALLEMTDSLNLNLNPRMRRQRQTVNIAQCTKKRNTCSNASTHLLPRILSTCSALKSSRHGTATSGDLPGIGRLLVSSI